MRSSASTDAIELVVQGDKPITPLAAVVAAPSIPDAKSAVSQAHTYQEMEMSNLNPGYGTYGPIGGRDNLEIKPSACSTALTSLSNNMTTLFGRAGSTILAGGKVPYYVQNFALGFVVGWGSAEVISAYDASDGAWNGVFFGVGLASIGVFILRLLAGRRAIPNVGAEVNVGVEALSYIAGVVVGGVSAAYGEKKAVRIAGALLLGLGLISAASDIDKIVKFGSGKSDVVFALLPKP